MSNLIRRGATSATRRRREPWCGGTPPRAIRRDAATRRFGPHPLTVHLPSLLLCLLIAAPLAAQTRDTTAVGEAGVAAASGVVEAAADSEPRPPRKGAQFRIPLASVAVPGLGQYRYGAHGAGIGYSATAVGAAALAYWAAGGSASSWNDFPRRGRDQFAVEAVHVSQSASFLSAWDAFQRGVPSLQREGKYEFLTTRETLGDLLTAPFEPEFLTRPTTWAHLAYTGLVATLLVGGREAGVDYVPFRPQDAAFATSLSYNAGVSEEALFRGWLFPLLYQNVGERFWLSNSLQAGIFGLLHLGQAGPFTLMITTWALYEGWLTRRNDWSIRESIFHHFWYDVAIVVAEMLVEERRPALRITLPTIRF